MDWVFLALGGFVLGSVAWLGFLTVWTEPEIRWPFIALGAGMSMIVTVNAWVVFFREVSFWFEVVTMLGYVLIAAAFATTTRIRQTKARES